MGAPTGDLHAPSTSTSSLLQPPEEFCCPITGHLMRSPVTLVESFEVYDRKNLEEWFAQGNNTDPLSGVQLTSHEFKPDNELRTRIVQWLQQEKARLAEQRARSQSPQAPSTSVSGPDSVPSAPSSPAFTENKAGSSPAAYPNPRPASVPDPITPAYPNLDPNLAADPGRDRFAPAGFPNVAGNRFRPNAPASPPPSQPSTPPTPPSSRGLPDHAQSFNYGGSPPKHSRDSSRAFSEPGQPCLLACMLLFCTGGMLHSSWGHQWEMVASPLAKLLQAHRGWVTSKYHAWGALSALLEQCWPAISPQILKVVSAVHVISSHCRRLHLILCRICCKSV